MAIRVFATIVVILDHFGRSILKKKNPEEIRRLSDDEEKRKNFVGI
jgi:hypothetical protein